MKSMIIANWKMNPVTVKDAKRLFDATKKAVEKARDVSIIVAPPALFLEALQAGYRGKRIVFAAQNAHFEASGAYTGEISMQQMKQTGAAVVLVGHAERRALGETNEDTRKKVAAALAAKLVPVLCVGEAKRTQSGDHFDFIREQLQAGFADVPKSMLGKVVIAYEPLWAIGATAAMSPRDMHEMAIFIRKSLVDLYGPSLMSVKILYGGSIDAQNAPAMLLDGDVHGLLVGRVSTDGVKFKALIDSIAKI